jgi:EmrB/QacA subfamily drug resistance transporter
MRGSHVGSVRQGNSVPISGIGGVAAAERGSHGGAMRDAGQGTEQAARRRWLGLGVLLLGSFIGALDAFIVTTALPSIRSDLPATFGQTQLIVVGYGTVFAVGLGIGGRLGDRHGHRRLFLAGITLFVTASVAAAAAPGPVVLITARVAQGLGAAAALPQVLSIIRSTFPDDERSTAVGWYGATVGLGVVSGPALGGVLLALDLAGWGWRWVFLINLPFGLAVLAGAALLVEESAATVRHRMDVAGAGMAAAGLGALLVPLTTGAEAGWPVWTVPCLLTGILLLAGFVARQRRLDAADATPLLPLRLFRDRRFSGGVTTILVLNAAGTGAALLFCLSYYLQTGLGLTPLRTGLVLAVVGLGFCLGSLVAPRLSRRYGPAVVVAGISVLIVGLAGLVAADRIVAASDRPLALVPALLVAGIGQGLTNNPLITLVMLGVDRRDAGAASGIYHTTGELGNAFGLAVFGSVFLMLLTGDAADAGPAAFSYALRGTAALLMVALCAALILAYREVPPSNGRWTAHDGLQ